MINYHFDTPTEDSLLVLWIGILFNNYQKWTKQHGAEWVACSRFKRPRLVPHFPFLTVLMWINLVSSTCPFQYIVILASLFMLGKKLNFLLVVGLKYVKRYQEYVWPRFVAAMYLESEKRWEHHIYHLGIHSLQFDPVISTIIDSLSWSSDTYF